jgi:hypothetical protein
MELKWYNTGKSLASTLVETYTFPSQARAAVLPATDAKGKGSCASSSCRVLEGVVAVSCSPLLFSLFPLSFSPSPPSTPFTLLHSRHQLYKHTLSTSRYHRKYRCRKLVTWSFPHTALVCHQRGIMGGFRCPPSPPFPLLSFTVPTFQAGWE